MCLFSFEKVAIIENIISSAVLLDCLKLRSVLYAFLSVNFKDYAGSDRGFSGFQNVWFRGSRDEKKKYYVRVTCSNLHKFEKGKKSAPFEGSGVFVNLERKYQQQTIIGHSCLNGNY